MKSGSGSTESTAIIVSRDPTGNTERRQFEDALLDALRQGAVRTVVVPHVYALRPGDAVLDRLADLAAAPSRWIVAAWLYPRATRWVLGNLGLATVEAIEAVDCREFDFPEACAERLLASAGASGTTASPGEVEEIAVATSPRWYPVLDYERCVDCRQCLDFCLFGVYALADDGRVRAVQPDNCKPGCPACARVCPAEAIMFPEYAGSTAIAGGPPDEAPATGALPTPECLAGDAGDELDALMDALDELDEA
jgi:Pyruvate/2-oxoacid:ferredoxin oxidoreductase delta subunit